MPTPLLKNKSPHEILHNFAPSYEHLEVFGCLCFASTLNNNISKFDARAKNVYFLVIHLALGYKLFDLESKSVFISRDIVLQELSFQYNHEVSNVHLEKNIFFLSPYLKFLLQIPIFNLKT